VALWRLRHLHNDHVSGAEPGLSRATPTTGLGAPMRCTSASLPRNYTPIVLAPPGISTPEHVPSIILLLGQMPPSLSGYPFIGGKKMTYRIRPWTSFPHIGYLTPNICTGIFSSWKITPWLSVRPAKVEIVAPLDFCPSPNICPPGTFLGCNVVPSAATQTPSFFHA